MNLKLFWKGIEEFFEKQEFQVTSSQPGDNYCLMVEGSPNYRISGAVKMTLTGTEQDFSIQIEQERKAKERKYSIPITLATSLGMGFLLVDEFKSDEAFLKLKKDLWIFADETVQRLTNSANTP